jgi:hypothetical protein
VTFIKKPLLAAIAMLCLFSMYAHAARVTWRASGVVTSVGSYVSPLPFTPTVGQAFVIDMVMENDASAVFCADYGPNVMACNNIFSALLYVGNTQMAITPSMPGTTTFWNDYVIGPSPLDYYSMPIVDGVTQWEVGWAVQTPVAMGTTGPLTSLSLLQSPPDVTAFQFRQMTLTPAGGGYAPAVIATLNSVTVLGPTAPNPTVNQSADSGGGGGEINLIFVLLLAACAFAAQRLKTKATYSNRM